MMLLSLLAMLMCKVNTWIGLFDLRVCVLNGKRVPVDTDSMKFFIIHICSVSASSP